MQSLKGLNERFGGLFAKPDEEDDGADGQPSIGFKRWGWMITLDNLSQSDPTKYPYYYALNVIEFLTILSYYNDKRKEEERRNEIERLKRSSSR